MWWLFCSRLPARLPNFPSRTFKNLQSLTITSQCSYCFVPVYYPDFLEFTGISLLNCNPELWNCLCCWPFCSCLVARFPGILQKTTGIYNRLKTQLLLFYVPNTCELHRTIAGRSQQLLKYDSHGILTSA